MDALNYGLIDEIVADPASGGEAFARKVLREATAPPAARLRLQAGAAKADRSIFTDAIAA
ncbi:hypothetical protein [Bradyrhizobium sp. STM 3561]|uniref:hypothetical protein n=1 Tax=Bradyrhizobium sp. STM 3561 TaxID=578923 RepID=UPI003890CC08